MRRRSSPQRSLGAGAVLAVLLGTSGAHGDEAAPPSSLRGRVGVEAAAALMASPSPSDRIRGLERLGSAGTPRALARLERALEPGGSAVTAEERLTAVRTLAEFTGSADVRRALARVLGGHATPTSTDAPAPLDVLAEETAALALSRSGAPDALAALGKALVTPGRAGRGAHLALVAHPPKEQDLVLRAAALPTLELASTLSDLDDPRSRDALRSLVLRGAPETRAVAAIALGRLGDPEAAPLARQWREKSQPSVLRVAAARILAVTHAKDAPAAIAVVLDDDETAAQGIELALDAPDVALVPSLTRRLSSTAPEDLPRLLTAIARTGSAEGAKVLASLMSAPGAGDALARMPGSEAKRALAEALGKPATRRLAARAGTVRNLVLGEKIDGLGAALTALAASSDPGERALGLSAQAALDPSRLEALSQTPNTDVLVSLSGLLFLAREKVATRVAARLASASSEETRTALAFALAVPGAEETVPTAALVALVDAHAAASPLACRALAARDELRLRPMITELLVSPAPELRAHTALGLGRSEKPDATGLLERAYRFETHADVRRAIVRALGLRPGRPSRTLALARDLDPDPETRANAREGLSVDRRKDRERGGSDVLWLVGPAPAKGKPPPQRTIATPSGLFLPVVLGPDGQALAAGLPMGSSVLPVALAHEADDDSVRGVSGNEKSDRTKRPGP